MHARGLALGLVVLSGCLKLGTGGGGDADGGAASPSDGTMVPAADGGIAAAGCARDPETRVELCTAVSACPTLVVDHDVFPFCGMRLRGDFFDLACWCNGFVCPMGAPTTCSEARRLLASQFESQVCSQISEGRCTQPQRDGNDAGAGSACDLECVRACGGSSACYDVCGCFGP